MRYFSLLFLLAALLYGCNGGDKGSKSQVDYHRTDSILKNMRSVDTLRMFVNTFHASHDDRGEVIAMRELGKRLREESKFSPAISTMLSVSLLRTQGQVFLPTRLRPS